MKKSGALLLYAIFSVCLTAVTAAAQAPVPLGTAANYAVLAGDKITNTGATTINGSLGLSPGTVVSGGPVVTGSSDVTDAAALQAKNDLRTAYLNAEGRSGPILLAGGTLGGRTLTSGLYKDDGAPASLGLTGTLTLDFEGNPNAVFIFQSASTLITAVGSRVSLINTGGGSGCNVFWQVGSAATLGTGTVFVGTIMAHDDISVSTGATVAGRLLAGGQANGAGALTLDTNSVTIPVCAAAPLSLTCAANIGQVSVGYSSALGVTGGTGPYTFSIATGTLPSGLTLNVSTGAISGTPTTAGSFSFTAGVTDSLAATATSPSCSIAIAPPPSTMVPPPGLACGATAGQVGVAYSSVVGISNGTGPYKFWLGTGSLPPGLTLNALTGAITGTPTVAGSFTFSEGVTDSLGEMSVSSCGIAIAQASTSLPTVPDLTITKNHAGNFQPGGTGSYTLTVTNIGAGPTVGMVSVSDGLPAGLTATGISGTGWSCTLASLSCTRSDALAAGAAYPPIAVTVNVGQQSSDGNPPGNSLIFQPGDIVLPMADGTVQWRGHDWTLVKIITSATDGQANGNAFDASGNLFVTHYYGTGFLGNSVVKFDPNGDAIGSFGRGYNCNPSSIAFDKTGNAYVGQADCGGNILKFDPQGNPVAQYHVAVESRGSNHIVLDSDQCTIYYTSEGSHVKRFNVCANTQMPDFNGTPVPDAIGGAQQFARLPDGGVLVANFSAIARLDASGNLVRVYNAPAGDHCWLGMALDPDGASFWALNWCESSATRFNMMTGSAMESHVATDLGFVIQGITVVPSAGSTIIVNTAAVSGGGEVNISNNSASDATTIITQPPTPVLSIASTYCVGGAWNAAVSNALPDATVRLIGTTNGQSWVVADWGTSDANGNLSQAGAFAAGAQANYTLTVEVDGMMSNTIPFAVASCDRSY